MSRSCALSRPGPKFVAGGSIHVYGTLRGRALAGSTGKSPRPDLKSRILQTLRGSSLPLVRSVYLLVAFIKRCDKHYV